MCIYAECNESTDVYSTKHEVSTVINPRVVDLFFILIKTL